MHLLSHRDSLGLNCIISPVMDIKMGVHIVRVLLRDVCAMQYVVRLLVFVHLHVYVFLNKHAVLSRLCLFTPFD